MIACACSMVISSLVWAKADIAAPPQRSKIKKALILCPIKYLSF